MMVNRQYVVRTCVMIVEEDVDCGTKLADWLAAHGYQAVLLRSVEAAIEELGDLRPQVVFVGQGFSESAAPNGVSELLLLIQAVCPGVPVITILDQTHKDMTEGVFRQGVHHVLIKPVEFTPSSQVRRSEFSSATA